MKYVVAILVVTLIVLHQDNWNWDNDRLLFGFLPIGLFYHACISIGASAVWLIAVKFAWPHELEVEADVEDSSEKESSS